MAYTTIQPISAPVIAEWPICDPGRMIHRVNIQKPTQGWDVSGPVVVWETFIPNAWAAIEPIRGTDIVHSGQVTTMLYITVTMMWQTGVRPNYRVDSHRGTFVIQSVENPRELNVLLVLNCVELTDVGS